MGSKDLADIMTNSCMVISLSAKIVYAKYLLCPNFLLTLLSVTVLSALTLLVGRQEGHLARKKTEW